MASGGGKPRWGVLILRVRLSGRGGSTAAVMAAGKLVSDDGCGGEYTWGFGYPFCNGGFRVSNMSATCDPRARREAEGGGEDGYPDMKTRR